MLNAGLYEQLINHTLRQELDTIPPERKSVKLVDPTETAEVLSRYIAEAAKRTLSGMAEGRGDVADQVALANRLIELLPETDGQGIDDRAEPVDLLRLRQLHTPHLIYSAACRFSHRRAACLFFCNQYVRNPAR